jgi:peptide/nickel transport system substrate-binding protein
VSRRVRAAARAIRSTRLTDSAEVPARIALSIAFASLPRARAPIRFPEAARSPAGIAPARPVAPVRARPFRATRSVNKETPMPRSVRLRYPIVFLLLTVATALGLAAPPAADAQKKRVMNIAAKEPDTLDPHGSTLGQSQAISRFMFRGLTRFAIKDGKVTTAEVEPDLAESWTVSPDGTLFTFKLRKGVQFHKGYGEMTAEDVKFSFERQIKRAPGTRFTEILEPIKGIEIIDPHTVQIQLKSFDPIFLLRMVGYQQGYIVSKKAVEKSPDQFKWNPVGTGPFYFERIPRGERS